MSGFSFPPPPPPPPPKASPVNGHQTAPKRGAFDRGRGRGGRESAQHQSRGQPGGRGYHGQDHYQPGRAPAHQSSIPNGFSNRPMPPHTGANSDGNSIAFNSDVPQNLPSGNWQPPAGSPPRTAAGHKRKLDVLRGPPQKKPESKPAPATAPPIPTFGAPLLPQASSPTKVNFKTTTTGPHKQKSANRSLGLTPGAAEPHYSSSDSEDEENALDEEAMYAELGDKLTFEHNGVVMSLNSQADLLAWKRDRQKLWPTKARMMTKNEERRQIGEKRKRLLAGAEVLYGGTSRFSKPGSNIWTNAATGDLRRSHEEDVNTPADGPHESATPLENAKREMAEKTRRLEELRRKVTESEERNRKARDDAEHRRVQSEDTVVTLQPENSAIQATLTDASTTTAVEDELPMTAEQDTHDDPSPNSPSASDTESSPSSASDDEAPSSDEAPEEVPSKPPAPNLAPTDTRPPCKFFRASGWCRDGEACRFAHDVSNHHQQPPQRRPHESAAGRQGHVRKDERPPKLESSAAAGKKTIFQRLVEQEEEEGDRLALKVVKYLGQAGFFREV